MPKARKAGSKQKPPEPSASHAAIDEWMQNLIPRLLPIITGIDELIRKTIPGLRYAVKWKKAYYGLPDRGWIIELASYDVSANVVFHAGRKFNPPPPLGESGDARYVKVKTLEEALSPEMRQWIEQAARLPGWR